MAAHSLARQIKELRAEITQLAARRNDMGWVVVEVGIGEDKTEEISSLEAQGYSVLVREIRPAPPLTADVLTDELRTIAEESAKLREIMQEERDRPRQFLLQPKKVPFEQPFPLNYPKQVY